MRRDPLAAFSGIHAPGDESPPAPPPSAPDNYPGSKVKRKAVAKASDPWANKPSVELTYKGKLRLFYAIGVLAEMLDRQPGTIRKWERLGYLPESFGRSPGRNINGQKRLYTREQIEAIVTVAREEGLLSGRRNIAGTKFVEKVAARFEKLK